LCGLLWQLSAGGCGYLNYTRPAGPVVCLARHFDIDRRTCACRPICQDMRYVARTWTWTPALPMPITWTAIAINFGCVFASRKMKTNNFKWLAAQSRSYPSWIEVQRSLATMHTKHNFAGMVQGSSTEVFRLNFFNIGMQFCTMTAMYYFAIQYLINF